MNKMIKFIKEAIYIGLILLYFRIFGLGLGFLIIILFALILVIWVRAGKKKSQRKEEVIKCRKR